MLILSGTQEYSVEAQAWHRGVAVLEHLDHKAGDGRPARHGHGPHRLHLETFVRDHVALGLEQGRELVYQRGRVRRLGLGDVCVARMWRVKQAARGWGLS